NPVNEVVANIKNADLHSQFNSTRKDEIGLLQQAFDGFVLSIKQTLVQVSEASAAVASASTQISSSTEELAAGAQEQSSQSAEVAGAVEEMTKTIMENSRNAGDTATTAKKAKDTAVDGGDVVRQTVDGMKEIAKVVNKSADTVKALGKSSDQIGEIISVIDDIADQTNLLALNAAIEAARAGEQGRGFAVVADEVRKLAERTTKATKEIASMIKQIQTDTKEAVISMDEGTKKVSDGIILADRAGASLEEIVQISQSVTDKISQIAAASEQQSSASEQISKNVEAISAVTSQSASGTQQIARTAEDLNRLTENLQEILAKFNLSASSDSGRREPSYHRTKPSVQKSKRAVSENGHLVEHH
nr:methyl-accepting chemotaxis protein [Bacteroidota bacterium]